MRTASFYLRQKLNVEDASGRQIAAIQHVPFSIPCTYVLTIEGQDYDSTRNFTFFSRSYSLMRWVGRSRAIS